VKNVTSSLGSIFRVPVSASLGSAGERRGAAIGAGVEFTGKQREDNSLTCDCKDKYRNSDTDDVGYEIPNGANEILMPRESEVACRHQRIVEA